MTSELFMTRQRPCAVAFEAACLSIECIIPVVGVSKNFSHSGQGSPVLRLPAVSPQEPHPSTTGLPPSWISRTNGHSSDSCDGYPGATSLWFTPAKLPSGAWEWLIAQKPRRIVAPCTVHSATLLVCFQFEHNASGGSVYCIYTHTQRWCCAERPTWWPPVQIRPVSNLSTFCQSSDLWEVVQPANLTTKCWLKGTHFNSRGGSAQMIN